jgi:hypothetical protein
MLVFLGLLGALLVATKLSFRRFRPGWGSRSLIWISAVLLPPAVNFAASWIFHLGFPLPPLI